MQPRRARRPSVRVQVCRERTGGQARVPEVQRLMPVERSSTGNVCGLQCSVSRSMSEWRVSPCCRWRTVGSVVSRRLLNAGRRVVLVWKAGGATAWRDPPFKVGDGHAAKAEPQAAEVGTEKDHARNTHVYVASRLSVCPPGWGG